MFYKSVHISYGFETAPALVQKIISTLATHGFDYHNLPRPFVEVIQEINSSHNFETENMLFKPWVIDYNVIDISQGPHNYRKPKIDITVEDLGHGNLSVRWYPRGHFDRDPGPSDFAWFGEGKNHRQRPANELLYVRGFIDTLRQVQERTRGSVTLDTIHESNIADAIIYSVKKAVDELIRRLEPLFDVRVLSNIFIHLDDESSSKAMINLAVLCTTKTYNDAMSLLVDERDFENFENVCGFTLDTLLKAQAQLHLKEIGLNPLSRTTYANNLIKVLRSFRADTTPKRVQRALDLADRFVPDFIYPARDRN